MSRDNVRLITTTIPDFFTARSREDEVIIPPWYIDGSPFAGSESGAWVPKQDYIIITEWYVQAGIVGPGNTSFSIMTGDNVWYPEGGGQPRRSLTLTGRPPAGERRLSDQQVSEVIQTAYDHIVISSRNWLKIKCTASGGHQNVTVQLYGRVM